MHTTEIKNNLTAIFFRLLLSSYVIGIFLTGAHMTLNQIVHGCLALSFALGILSLTNLSLLVQDIGHHRALANSPSLKPARPRAPASAAYAGALRLPRQAAVRGRVLDQHGGQALDAQSDQSLPGDLDRGSRHVVHTAADRDRSDRSGPCAVARSRRAARPPCSSSSWGCSHRPAVLLTFRELDERLRRPRARSWPTPGNRAMSPEVDLPPANPARARDAASKRDLRSTRTYPRRLVSPGPGSSPG